MSMTRDEALRHLTASGEAYQLDLSVVDGTPQRVFAKAPQTLRALYQDNLSDRPFIVFDDDRYSFLDTWNHAARIAHVLAMTYGVAKGDRVAIGMRNYPEWMMAFMAVTSLGAVAVAINALWRADEMGHAIADSGAKVLIADEDRIDRLEQSSAAGPIAVLQARGAEKPGRPHLGVLTAKSGAVTMPPATIAADDLATLFYTSGSSGRAKGVASTHRQIISALLSWELDDAAKRPSGQAAKRLPGLDRDVHARSVQTVGVVGGGLMGTGITIALLSAGLSVTMVELRDEALAKAQATVRQTIERDVAKGRIDRETADARIAAFSPARSLDALAAVDLAVEAVFEDMAVKRKIFSALDAVTRLDTILASNTSTLDLDEIASCVRDPSRVVGLHFFSPANIMKLLEVVRGRQTAPDVLVTAMTLAKRIGKVGVVAGVCDGFIGNRIFEEYLRQVYFMLEEGALPQQIDAAMEKWGMAMGPCRTMDLVGQDIGWAIRKRRVIEQPDRPYSGVIDRICDLGRFGQKTSKGIYAYSDGRTATVDPEIDRLIIDYSAEIGLMRRSIDDDEIVMRCLLAMAHEGAQIVEEGVACRPVDVDVVLLNGYGFPRERGGPMFQADCIGLSSVAEKIASFASGRNGWAWKPASLIETLARRNRTFDDLNRYPRCLRI